VYNINWVDVSVELLLYLANIAVSDIRGKIAIYEPDTSKNAVTFDVKNALVKKFGNIDNPEGNLYITYFIRKATEVKINGKRYLREVGSYEYDVKPTNAYANDFTNITLQMDENPFATISGTTVNVNQVSPTAFYTNLKGVYTSIDGTELEAEIKVGLFDMQAEPGDYVYYDGEYGKPDEWDKVTPVVGICFYVNPDDPTDRRMIATNIPSTCRIIYMSGIDPKDFTNLALLDEPTYDVYRPDVYYMHDNSNADTSGGKDVVDDTYKNADGTFKKQETTKFFGYMQLVELDEDIEPYKKGDAIPVGQYDTLKIIKHRNKVLSDSAFNLPIPQKDNTVSEFDNVTRLRNEIVASNGNERKYEEYYYMHASLSYAYEPIIDKNYKLNDKFKSHKWYNLSSGELVRLMWYQRQSVHDQEDGIWRTPMKDKLLYDIGYANVNYSSYATYSFMSAGTSTFARGNYNTDLKTARCRPPFQVTDTNLGVAAAQIGNTLGDPKVLPVCRF
jgi:hypothetical protein